MKKNVLFRGPVLTESGYGVHSRQVFKWLEKKDVNLFVQATNWGNTPWKINKDNKLVRSVLEKTSVPQIKFDYTFQLQLPNEWDPSLGNYNFGMSAMVETTQANPGWVQNCNQMDCVIVPSNHAKNSVLQSGIVVKPFHVVPESYVESIDEFAENTIDLQLETNFNFLLFGQITGDSSDTDRKNTLQSIKWFCETFKNDKDVGLVLKTNCGNNTSIDKSRTLDLVKSLVREFKVGNFPKIYLLHGAMSDKDVASLYKHPKINALISLTRGEGFGLPTLEAAASDLPVIATNWSGHLDFLNHGKFIKIDYDLVEISNSRVDNKIFMKGSKWAEPKEFMAKKALKKFKESSTIPKQWAEDLGKTIRKEYSQCAIEQKYDKLMLELGISL